MTQRQIAAAIVAATITVVAMGVAHNAEARDVIELGDGTTMTVTTYHH